MNIPEVKPNIIAASRDSFSFDLSTNAAGFNTYMEKYKTPLQVERTAMEVM